MIKFPFILKRKRIFSSKTVNINVYISLYKVGLEDKFGQQFDNKHNSFSTIATWLSDGLTGRQYIGHAWYNETLGQQKGNPIICNVLRRTFTFLEGKKNFIKKKTEI